MRLKIDDDFLDMDNSIIAQSYAVNQIGDITTRQGGFSNDFTIPLTAKNKEILGFPDDVNSSSDNPYSKVDATLYDRSVPVADGYLRYQITTNNRLECSFFSDNSDWFNLIKDKKLTDIDLSDYDHTYDYTTIATAINADKDSGYTYPLIDYGEFEAKTDLEATASQMFPALFVHTIIDSLFFDIGWKVTGEVTEHPLYKRLIIPFSAKKFVHDSTWLSDNQYTDTDPVGFAFDNTGTLVTWVTAASTDIDVSTAGLERGSYTITVTCDVTMGAGNSFAIQLRKNGSNIAVVGFIAGAQDGEFNVVATTELDPGTPDLISVRLVALNAAPLGTLNSASISITAEPGVVIDSEVQMSAAMPDIKQTDFLKYLAQILGIVFQANNLSKTVTFSFFDFDPDDAVDWSDKLDMSKTIELDFTELLNKYAKQSILTYKEDDEDAELKAYEAETGQRLGQGQYDINNEHIDGIKTIYEAPFSPMININSFQNTIYIPQIRFKEARFWDITAIQNNGGNAELVLDAVASDIGVGDFVKIYETTNYNSRVDVTAVSNNLVTISTAFGASETGLLQADDDDTESTPKIALLSENIGVDVLTNENHSLLRIFDDNSEGANSTCSDIPFCWFVKTAYVEAVDDLLDSLAFDQVAFPNVVGDPLKDRFLKNYEDILNEMKYLKAYFHLTEIDINALDFTVPVYIERYKAYFYISKINDYQGSKRVTECELVKIG